MASIIAQKNVWINNMLIIGNKNIPYQNIKEIEFIDDIKNISANTIVYFKYDIDIIKYCSKNNIRSAVEVLNITEAIFCNCLGVYFIISNTEAKQIQKVAENYMFDSKILQIINSDNDIQKVAIDEIDGCIYKEILC